MGPKRDRLDAGLHVAFHSPYAIYYLPTEMDVLIVRVLYGARDVAAIADQGGFAQ